METVKAAQPSSRGSRLVKILFTAGLVFVCGVTFGVFILGARQPLDHRVEASRLVAAPLDSVWARLAGFERYPRWRPELDLVQVEALGGDTLVYREFIRAGRACPSGWSSGWRPAAW
jgi:hypothetical protein